MTRVFGELGFGEMGHNLEITWYDNDLSWCDNLSWHYFTFRRRRCEWDSKIWV